MTISVTDDVPFAAQKTDVRGQRATYEREKVRREEASRNWRGVET